jgi:hypothetical protein
MLSKITKDNIKYGTEAIQDFAKYNDFDIIQDNLYDKLLVKHREEIYIYNYRNKKRYNYNRIKIEFNNKYFFKQICSFDQNNIKQSKIIRKTVLNLFYEILKTENILGIGGEYYIYFPFLNYKTYYGISNHISIIEDANYNSFTKNKYNYLVDYNNLHTYPKLNKKELIDIIINVVNIHENIIKYISKLNCKNIILITCKPLEKKIKMLNKYLILKKINHILNINSYITICLFNIKK